MALGFFKRHQLKVWARNQKIWGVEHDFIVSNAQGEWIFVEVKSLSRLEDLEWRIKPSQRRRLIRSAGAFIQSRSAKSLGVWLLAIESQGNMHFIPLQDDF